MESAIKNHYNSDNLAKAIEAALIKAGKTPATIKTKDLGAIDQLHTGGARSSIELFNKIKLSSEALVLDAGCGIGGSSRLLSEYFNCRVIGLDLADKFVEAATFLTKCNGLDDRVSFQQGSVLDLPFEDNTFNAVLCQHVLMNIKDKSKAINEFCRVLKPGGKLILHEITKGNPGDLFLPVPWAAASSISFLEPWDDLIPVFEKNNFETDYFSDKTKEACVLWHKLKKAFQNHPPRPGHLGPGLIFGNNAKFFGKNMHANFKSNLICLVEAVLKKSYDI